MVENNDNIQQRDEETRRAVEDTLKKKQGIMYAHGRGLQRENRRKRSKKLGRSWEKKIQRQGGNKGTKKENGLLLIDIIMLNRLRKPHDSISNFNLEKINLWI
jgi:hypothetical protein